MAEILFYPSFPTRPQLYDQLYRSLWNLLPAVDLIDRLIFPYSGDDLALLDADQAIDMADVLMSRDFDPAIAAYAPRWRGKIAFVRPGDIAPKKLKGVIVWNT